MHTYDIEYTDTYGGQANYSWVIRKCIVMPELTHYGYDGETNYAKANRVFERELMRRAKAAVGLTGVRGIKDDWGGDLIAFRPHKHNSVMFITYRDE